MIIENPAVNTKKFLSQLISLAVDQIDGFIDCQTDETFIGVLEYQKKQIKALKKFERIQSIPKTFESDIFRALQYAQDELESMLDDGVCFGEDIKIVTTHKDKIKNLRRSVYGRTMGEVIDDRIEANRKKGNRSETFDVHEFMRKKRNGN